MRCILSEKLDSILNKPVFLWMISGNAPQRPEDHKWHASSWKIRGRRWWQNPAAWSPAVLDRCFRGVLKLGIVKAFCSQISFLPQIYAAASLRKCLKAFWCSQIFKKCWCIWELYRRVEAVLVVVWEVMCGNNPVLRWWYFRSDWFSTILDLLKAEAGNNLASAAKEKEV